jgi:hypothetical protein
VQVTVSSDGALLVNARLLIEGGLLDYEQAGPRSTDTLTGMAYVIEGTASAWSPTRPHESRGDRVRAEVWVSTAMERAHTCPTRCGIRHADRAPHRRRAVTVWWRPYLASSRSEPSRSPM